MYLTKKDKGLHHRVMGSSATLVELFASSTYIIENLFVHHKW